MITMRRTMTAIVLCAIAINLYSQNISRLDKMQGIWSHSDNGYTENNQFQYSITNGNKTLGISYIENDSTFNILVSETIEGFLNYDPKSSEETINIKDFLKDGEYYFWMLKNAIDQNGNIDQGSCYVVNLSFEDDVMVIYSRDESRFNKISRLPSMALYRLYFRGKLDNRNYIKEYLGLDVRNVIVEKSIIYDRLEVKTEKYLVKNDLITVTGEQNSFFKMKYETDKGEIIEGLIKKENVQGIIEKKRIDVENEN